MKYINDLCISTISLAVSRNRKNKEGKYESDFFTVKALGKTGEFVEKYFKKGMKIGIRGKIQNENWTDKDGQKRHRDVIVADEINFIESKAESEKNVTAAAPKQESNTTATNPDEFMDIPNGLESDLPFV